MSNLQKECTGNPAHRLFRQVKRNLGYNNMGRPVIEHSWECRTCGELVVTIGEIKAAEYDSEKAG